MRLTVSAAALLGAVLAAVLAWGAAAAGTAPSAAAAPPAATSPAAAGPQACTAYARAAISRHQVVTAVPPACRGLSRAQVSQAAGTAIRIAETGRTKSGRRRQAVAAGRWLRALITAPVPAAGEPPEVAAPAGQAAPARLTAGTGRGLGGVSELAAKAGALLAWLAAAASGGWLLARWLLAGGRPLRRSATAAPPAVTLAHAGGAALGLALWAAFLVSGRPELAWTAVGLLAPVAGLGLGVLLLGLPAPVGPALGTAGRRRRRPAPALAIAAHGLFAVTTLLLVLAAAVGAG